jgi:hypothetical protein
MEDEYSHCPICGEPIHDGDCDPFILNETRKPRFYKMDLHLYKDEFLVDIIMWYDERCRLLEEERAVRMTIYDVLIRAKRWWENNRPCRWTEEEHVASPCVNTVNEVDARLAEAVVEYLKEYKKMKNK